jgi:hypothetical protein
MTILFYIPADNGSEDASRCFEDGKTLDADVEVCHSLESLTVRLLEVGRTPEVAVLHATSKRKLRALGCLRSLLGGIAVILILPDREQATISAGHAFRPRFLTFEDADPTEVTAVLKQMLQYYKRTGVKRFSD